MSETNPEISGSLKNTKQDKCQKQLHHSISFSNYIKSKIKNNPERSQNKNTLLLEEQR